MSRAYTGLDAADVTVPGIVIIRKDGQIVHRQIATGKADRLTTDELLAQIDRSLGTTGPGARRGYEVFERLQLRVDAGGGYREHVTAGGNLAALFPLHRYLLIGPWIGGNARDGVIDLDGALAFRFPLLADRGAIQLTAAGGWSVIESGPNASARIGAWLALNPSWAIHLDVGAGAHWVDEERSDEVFATFGVTRLLRIR